MISIIISSSNSEYLKDIKINVEETIGADHELIVMDNLDGEKGLCEVYNIGSIKAKYNILCFMHEDISIKTLNWGQKVIEFFTSNPNLGLLGISGCNYKSLAPSAFTLYMQRKESLFMNNIQHFKFVDKPKEHNYLNPTKQLTPVTSVDGVWFCTTKKISTEFPFDEAMLKGFHCYDLDFSLQVSTKYQVAVTLEILLEHYSEGNYNKCWAEDTIAVHQKWKKNLPIDLGNMTKEEIITLEIKCFRSFIQILLFYNFPINKILTIINQSDVQKLLGNLELIKLYLATFAYNGKWFFLGKNKMQRKIVYGE